MLKFLEGRENEGRMKAKVRNRPQIAFGVSLESPTSMQTKYSLISPTSFINPYVQIEKRRVEGVAPSKLSFISPQWVRKTNISLVEEGKVIGSGDLSLQPNRYHLKYRQEIQKDSCRFRLTKGEFTNYVERNHSNNEGFGPLYGQERSAQKSLETKRSGFRESAMMLEKSREKLELQQMMRKKSSKALMKMIDEKRTLRHKREDFYHHYNTELSTRKQKFQESFVLPKVITHRDNPHQTKHLDFGVFRTIDNTNLTSYIK